MAKLNALFIKSISKPGRYSDGGGLYLLVKPSGSRSWVFRYMFRGKRRDLGLGSLSSVSLSEARQVAFEARRTLLSGAEPLARSLIKKEKSFKDCLDLYLDKKRATWKTKKQEQDIINSFENHAPDLLGMNINSISLQTVVNVLNGVWYDKTETGTRIQSRMESVLGLARVLNHRHGDNPAAWKGNLEHVFPKRSAINTVEHHKALPFVDVPDFFLKLKGCDHTSYRALKFLILTCTRTSETLRATWDEVDLENRVWIIPAERMKKAKEHRVPLSDQAHEILLSLKIRAENQYIFPSRVTGKHLSGMACLEVMREFKMDEVPHGFRSTFKDWASECTNHPGEISEMALAHSVRNKTEAAYRRGDLFEKRKLLMQDWADYCTSKIK